MSGLKALSLLGIVSAAALIVVKKQMDNEKRNQELDEFLLYGETEPVVIHVDGKTNLNNDIENLAQSKQESVTFLFEVEDSPMAIHFQEEVSKVGLSSNYNTEDKMVEVFYQDKMDEQALHTLILDLENVLEKVNAQYKGYRD